MTEKELHKLNRQDLLQLLLTQSKEVAQQKSTIEDLRHRLDEKDESLSRLKAEADRLRLEMETMRGRLEDKDLALDIARTRLDCMALSGVGSADPLVSEQSAPDPEDREARLRYLRELLQKSREAADRLRKGKE